MIMFETIITLISFVILSALLRLFYRFEQNQKRQDNHFKFVDEKMQKIDFKIEKVGSDLNTKIDKVELDLNAKIDKLDTKIDKLDSKIDKAVFDLNAKVDRNEAKFNTK